MYQNSWLPVIASEGSSKFEILLVKIFKLKPKIYQIVSATTQKIKSFFFKKTIFVYFRQNVTMGKCKTKAIQADLGKFTHITAYSDISHLFRHNQAYSRIIQAYSGIFRTLCIPGIFRTLSYSERETYSEPWYIQNPDPAIF